MEGRAKPKDPKQVVHYDAEMNALAKERDELKAYVEDLTGPNPELAWNRQAQQAARVSEELYRRRIAEGQLSKGKPETFPENAETKRLRAQAKLAKEEWEALREASGIPQAEALARIGAQLEERREAAIKRLMTGENPEKGQPKALPAALQALRVEVARLN
jgi:hypothetical protein